MKVKILYTLIVLFITFTVKSQKILNELDSLKKGIYANFEEFQLNKPSVAMDYEILTLKQPNGALFYSVNIDNKTAFKIGKVFGFCDGENVYIKISSHIMFSSKNVFSKIKNFNAYCLFEFFNINRANYAFLSKKEWEEEDNKKRRYFATVTKTDYNGNIVISGDMAHTGRFDPNNEGYNNYKLKRLENNAYYKILDIKTGKIRMLTQSRLKSIIKENKKLLKQFKSKSESYRKKPYALRDFLLKYDTIKN